MAGDLEKHTNDSPRAERPSRRDRSLSPLDRQNQSRWRSRSPAGGGERSFGKRPASRSPPRGDDKDRKYSPQQRGDRGRPSQGQAGRGRRRNEPGGFGGGGGGGQDPPWGRSDGVEEPEIEEKEPEPDFGLSGALAAETNTVNGVVLLHNEPPEARPPTVRWRLYVFKDGQPHGDPLYIHRQSRYIFGRERRVADVPTDHPSCSKQHAVLQYRLTEKESADGMMHAAARPYLMDLGSTNGSFLNGERIEPQRYYELLEKDMLRFGNSSREYVLLKEK